MKIEVVHDTHCPDVGLGCNSSNPRLLERCHLMKAILGERKRLQGVTGAAQAFDRLVHSGSTVQADWKVVSKAICDAVRNLERTEQ